MSKKHKKNKGKFVSDEGANRNYVKIAEGEGWTNIPISLSERGKKLSDSLLVQKYTKGSHPIFTTDKAAYKLTKELLNRSGYIIHKTANKGQEKEYELQVKNFFDKYTERHTHFTKWTIEYSGEAKKEKL